MRYSGVSSADGADDDGSADDRADGDADDGGRTGGDADADGRAGDDGDADAGGEGDTTGAGAGAGAGDGATPAHNAISAIPVSEVRATDRIGVTASGSAPVPVPRSARQPVQPVGSVWATACARPRAAASRAGRACGARARATKPVPAAGSRAP